MDFVYLIYKYEKYGMVINNVPERDEFETCVMANETKAIMRGCLVSDEEDIIIYSDICGPFRTATLGAGFRNSW